MKMTIHEIAKKAGVSIATISRAINPQTRDKVAGDTLRKIDHLLKKYSYTPNLAARNLRQFSTKIIGVKVPFYRDIFYSAYFMHFLSGVSNTLEGSGYGFKLLTLTQEQQQWDHYDFRSGEQIDGLIVGHWFRYFSSKRMLEKIKVPTVVFNDFEEDVQTMFVCGDHVHGGRIAAEYLYSCGHRHAAIITGPAWSRECQQRVKGFQEYWKDQGAILDQELVVIADFLKDKAKEALDQILIKEPKVTAIFCCTDVMASGVLERLKELNLSCPQDISVMGYDDDFMVINCFPYLTSIRVPVHEMAQKATQYLLEHLKGKDSRKPLVGVELLPVRLVERQSVKKLPS